jgi:hypothetical protein
MKITMVEDYKRRGNTINIRFKVEFEQPLTDNNNEQYNDSVIFAYLIYDNNQWTIKQRYQHEGYKFPQYDTITDNQLIDVMKESNAYKRIKKALKIAD